MGKEEMRRESEEKAKVIESGQVAEENSGRRPVLFVPPFAVPDRTGSGFPASGSEPRKEGDGCRSFSELLAGAMASPTGGSTAEAEMKQPNPVLTPPVKFAVASPQGLVGVPSHPRFKAKFEMSHQEALASVTAQAVQVQAGMQLQVGSPSCVTPSKPLLPSPLPVNPSPVQQRPASPAPEVNTSISEKINTLSELTPYPPTVARKRPIADGYSWRKYGQKQVKGLDSRSYYRCTDPSCTVKKTVEQNSVGDITEVVYKGRHNHDPPQKVRSVKDGGFLPTGPGSADAPDAVPPQHSSDGEELHRDEPDPKRRQVVMKRTSDPGTHGDGYRWRKYGQKMVKGSPNPRSYYKCTYVGCPVRKHVERSANDAKALLITYEGKHNHEIPAQKKTCDSSATDLLLAAAAITEGQFDNDPSKAMPSEKATSTRSLADVEGEMTHGRAAELGGEKALESAQTLLSIGFHRSSQSEDDGGAKNPDVLRRPLFNETHAAVSV